MAIALSPDKRRLVLDLQGGLWTLPIGGGAASRITDEFNDGRQPSWTAFERCSRIAPTRTTALWWTRQAYRSCQPD
jgi:hypothetical protein